MYKWVNKVDLSAGWNKSDFESDKELIAYLSQIAINALKDLKDVPEHLSFKQEELIESFASLIDDGVDDIDIFDYVLSDLYDFGDYPLDQHRRLLRVKVI